MIKIIENLLTRNRSGIGVLEDDVDKLEVKTTEVLTEENRQSTRLAVSLPVFYRIRGQWAKWFKSQTKDYSNTGVRLALPFGITKGTEVKLKLKLPDVDRPIEIQGVVVWTAPFVGNDRATVECGVAFQDVRKIPNKEKLFHFIADKLCHLGLTHAKDLIASPAENIEDLKTCYKIIYQGYLARGYCQENPSQLHYNYHAFLPKSRTLLLRDKGKIAGTISVIPDSPCGLPMDSLYQTELDQLRTKDRKLAEVSLLALASTGPKKVFSLTNFEKQFKLFRLFKILVEYSRMVEGVTDFVIGVHPKHASLYSYFGFKPFGQVKEYPGACGNLALPLRLDLVDAEINWPTTLKVFFLENLMPLEKLKSGLVMTDEVEIL